MINNFLIVTCILLFLQLNAHAQTHNGNLHETVTHRPDGSVKVEGVKNKNNTAATTFNRLSQENTMPQNNEFGTWSGLVTIFHKYITERLPQLDKDGLNHGIGVNSYDYKQWTKEDLRVLATAYNGVEMFDILATIKNAAAQVPSAELSAQDIQDAQNALEYLKPNSCKDWKAFGKMVDGVDRQTRTQRDALYKKKEERKSGSLLDLGKFDNIAGDPMDGLDQQKALEQLDKNAVKMDSEHSLKSPDPKAIALDVVKSIKGAVRAA